MNTQKKAVKVGIYTRISKDSSDHESQLLQLREYCNQMGYEIVAEYSETISGIATDRPEFNRMMKDASQRRFSLLLFYALDRLTRAGTRQTIAYLQTLESYGVAFRSYTEQFIDSSGIFRDVVIALLSTLAMQERQRISERVKSGLERSRKNGRIGGRPRLDDSVVAKIKALKSEGYSIMRISKELKVSRGSVYQYLL